MDKLTFLKIDKEKATTIYNQVLTYLELDYIIDPLSIQFDSNGDIYCFSHKIEDVYNNETYYEDKIYYTKSHKNNTQKDQEQIRYFKLKYLEMTFDDDGFTNDVIYQKFEELNKLYKKLNVNKFDLIFKEVKNIIRNGLYIKEKDTLNYLEIKSFKINNEKREIYLKCLRSDTMMVNVKLAMYLDLKQVLNIISDITTYRKIFTSLILENDMMKKCAKSILISYRTALYSGYGYGYNKSTAKDFKTFIHELHKICGIIPIDGDDEIILKTILNLKPHIETKKELAEKKKKLKSLIS